MAEQVDARDLKSRTSNSVWVRFPLAALFISLLMKKEFIIDQLRKDKIIYALEACAFTLSSIMAFIFAHFYTDGKIRFFLQISATVFAVSYTLYAGFGNLFRLIKIKKLENGE